MPKPLYEYHILTYYKTLGKMEPPLGGGWVVYKSRIRVQSLTVMVIWKRLIQEPFQLPIEERSKDLPCISGDPQCLGPYEGHETATKCPACIGYERTYPNGKAPLLEMLEFCESFIRDKKPGLPLLSMNVEFIKALRLHVSLHGIPSVDIGQRSQLETVFHSLFT
jgi:hypothetical protein